MYQKQFKKQQVKNSSQLYFGIMPKKKLLKVALSNFEDEVELQAKLENPLHDSIEENLFNYNTERMLEERILIK